MILLQREAETPLYEQLYLALRHQILDGELAAGQKLPSRRAMASRLGVSVNTVDAAYGQLISEGYVQAKARSGFAVCPVDAVQRVELAMPTPDPIPEARPQCAVDFNPSGMPADRFPLSVWQRLSREVLSDRLWLSRCPQQGELGLRQAVADYLSRARNVRCSAEQIIIGSGAEGLISLLGVLLSREVTFAVENPVYHRGYQMLLGMGHPVVAAEVDKQGIIPQRLPALEQAVVYTTPSHQYPLGICMPMARRVQLLNWCAEGAFRYLIEDDYDSEFRYDARPVPPLQSIDRNERVIYLGTFSGTVTPALRIGFLVLPPALLALYRSKCAELSCPVPTAEQLILREFMVGGYFEKHLNRMRTYYKRQRGILLEALARQLPQAQVIGEAAGCHLTLKVAKGRSQQWLCRRAEEQGVKVYPISRYFMGQMPEQYAGKVVLGFGGLSRAEIEDGVERLHKAWRDA